MYSEKFRRQKNWIEATWKMLRNTINFNEALFTDVEKIL